MTLEERLKEIETRAEAAKEHYDSAGENREIAMANYTMGDEYCTDVPALIRMLRMAIEQRNILCADTSLEGAESQAGVPFAISDLDEEILKAWEGK